MLSLAEAGPPKFHSFRSHRDERRAGKARAAMNSHLASRLRKVARKLVDCIEVSEVLMGIDYPSPQDGHAQRDRPSRQAVQTETNVTSPGRINGSSKVA